MSLLGNRTVQGLIREVIKRQVCFGAGGVFIATACFLGTSADAMCGCWGFSTELAVW